MPLNRKAGEKRLVDMSAPLPAWSPEMDTCDEFVQEFPINESVSYRIRMEMDERNRLVEWAVVQKRDGHRVAVYDVCHGKGYHLHLYDERGTEIDEIALRPVDSYADSEACLNDAVERIVRYWVENERRCDRDHK
jgi:hypothetical protein